MPTRQREVGTGVDEGGAAFVHHELGGVEARAVEASVGATDAAAAVCDEVGKRFADSRQRGARAAASRPA